MFPFFKKKKKKKFQKQMLCEIYIVHKQNMAAGKNLEKAANQTPRAGRDRSKRGCI